jgi:hypothetical protein
LWLSEEAVRSETGKGRKGGGAEGSLLFCQGCVKKSKKFFKVRFWGDFACFLSVFTSFLTIFGVGVFLRWRRIALKRPLFV